MLAIRFRRVGKKQKPTYRIVVAEHTLPLDGKFTQDLGWYNPHTKEIKINKEEVIKWLDNGAKPSNTVARLLEKEKINHKQVVVIQSAPKKSKKKVDENEKPKAQVAAEPAVEAETANEETVEETPVETAEEVPSEETASDTEEAPVAEEEAPAEPTEETPDK